MSRLAKGTSSDERRVQQLRTLIILFIAAIAAFCAGAPTWLVVNGLFEDSGGSLVPLSAAFVVAEAHFLKAVDLLDRIVR